MRMGTQQQRKASFESEQSTTQEQSVKQKDKAMPPPKKSLLHYRIISLQLLLAFLLTERLDI